MKQLFKTKAIKIFLFAFLQFVAVITNAQIGIGIANPAASAQLDVSSTNKGFLPPRMTQAQRDAIASPTAGLIIWCKDCGISGEIQVYNGLAWTNMVGANAAVVLPKTVTIGTQEWMTKNLDVVTYRNGDTIPQVTDSAEWAKLTTGAWCYYNNDPANGPVYGRLYNRSAINDPRGLAPLGWHIPDRSEMQDLQDFLGGEFSAGNKMRDTGTAHWNGPNTGATNESGFTGLAGGHRTVNGAFESKGVSASWWNTSEEVVGSERDAETFFLYNTLSLSGFYQNGVLYSKIFGYPDGIIVYYPTGIGLSVRCIKD